MPNMANYLENKLIDFIFRGQALSLPPSFYVALFTSPPSDEGAGTEVQGAGYARVSVVRSLNAWSSTQGQGSVDPSNGTSGETFNINTIQFPEPTATWGTVSHFALFDAAVGGNMLFWGQLTMPKTVNAGDSPPTFLAADMSYQIDN